MGATFWFGFFTGMATLCVIIVSIKMWNSKPGKGGD